jgi:hypothetical protein
MIEQHSDWGAKTVAAASAWQFVPVFQALSAGFVIDVLDVIIIGQKCSFVPEIKPDGRPNIIIDRAVKTIAQKASIR